MLKHPNQSVKSIHYYSITTTIKDKPNMHTIRSSKSHVNKQIQLSLQDVHNTIVRTLTMMFIVPSNDAKASKPSSEVNAGLYYHNHNKI